MPFKLIVYPFPEDYPSVRNNNFMKMQWLATLTLLITSIYGNDSVSRLSGIAKFWADDHKVLEQMYGRTSDRHLYNDGTPPQRFSYGIDNLENKQEEDKNENYQVNFDPEDFSDMIANSLANSAKQNQEHQTGETKSPLRLMCFVVEEPLNLERKANSHYVTPLLYKYQKLMEGIKKRNLDESEDTKTHDLNDSPNNIQEVIVLGYDAKKDDSLNGEEEKLHNVRNVKNKRRTRSGESKRSKSCSSGRCSRRRPKWIMRTGPFYL